MSHPRSVVIVEDDPEVANFVQDALRAWEVSMETSICINGRDAVNAILRQAPDVVVLDLMLPHLSGFEVLQQIKARCVHKPPKVLLMTAYHADGTETNLETLGADGFLAKPFTLDELYDHLRPLLEA